MKHCAILHPILLIGVGTKCMTVREAIDVVAGIILQILGDNLIVAWLVIVAVIPVYMPYAE